MTDWGVALKTLAHRWDGKRVAGLVMALVGIAIPIYLAYEGSSKNPPSAAVQGLIAFVSVVSQLGAAWAFSQVGVVSPSHPQGAVRRLERLRRRSAEARQVSDLLVDQPEMKLSDRREVLGQLSVWMSVIQEEVVEAMEDWYVAMPDAIKAGAKDGEEEGDGK